MSHETEPNLMDIHRNFSDSELGARLSQQIRYEKYKPEQVSDEQWVELLGADVNNLTHLPLTRGLTRSFTRNADMYQPELLSEYDKKVLETAALIHDWAEALLGDISYEDKTEEDELEEQRQLQEITSSLGGESEPVAALIVQARDEVVFSHDTRLGHIFNTVERLGYMRTALHASTHIAEDTAGECGDSFRWLIADVLSNHTVELLGRADQYYPVYAYLQHQKYKIAEAFTQVDERALDRYDPIQREIKRREFSEAKSVFEKWLQKVDGTEA